MSKITFRADDDLVREVEALDASKSEVMREALRAYLSEDVVIEESESIDELIDARIDAVLGERLRGVGTTHDVNLNVRVEPTSGLDHAASDAAVDPIEHSPNCRQCGEELDADHEFCPNCGERASESAFCQCGVELGSDWSFCPHCGRRTASADVLER